MIGKNRIVIIVIANISENGKTDIKIMLNHRVGHEKSVKIVFVKKSQGAATIIKKIKIVGIEGEQSKDLPNIGCSECPVVSDICLKVFRDTYLMFQELSNVKLAHQE